MQRQYQVARLGIHADCLRPFEHDLNLVGIGARSNGEVIFNPSSAGMKDKIYAGIYISDFHLAVLRDAVNRALDVSRIDIIAYPAGGLRARHVIPATAARKFHPDRAVREVERGWFSGPS